MKVFNFDAISLTMICLTTFVGLSCLLFSGRYLYGDRRYKSFMAKLAIMIIGLIVTFSADNIIVLSASWLLSNVLLVSLMIYKSQWKEAYNSGMLSLKYLLFGFVFFVASLSIFYKITGSLSLYDIVSYKFENNIQFTTAITLLSLFVIIQSGLLPFHKWITSSLNSPTSVSAIMHAGIVNGGGFIFVRFAKVYLQCQNILDVMFVFGFVAVIFATIWKLMQSDIKKMLACSTISQMGYMICQCSIGAFVPAMIHIVMHGIFKSSLFLHSPGSANEKVSKHYKKNFKCIVASILLGLIITAFFLYGSKNTTLHLNAELVFASIVFVFSCQFGMTIIEKHNSYIVTLLSLLCGCFAAMLYGQTILALNNAFGYNALIELKWMHLAFIAFLFVGWFVVMLRPKFVVSGSLASFLYIKLLNLSQPNDKTITTNRNSYNF